MRNCKHCGQRIIQRGTTILNVRGTPLNHHLSCTGQLPPAPATQSDGGQDQTPSGDTA
jgi:hypothetical protein